MADKTVYPYGTGGQLPSSIGIINDLTTGGADKALSAEMGKNLAEYVFMGSGTFAEAYETSKGNVVNFPWMLVDTDDEGNVIKKMIWHAGNGQFIDAIGAEVKGRKNGITVTVSAACDMKINGKIFELSQGENNISFAEIGATNNQAQNPVFYTAGSEHTDNDIYKAPLTKIDFGGFITLAGWDILSSYPNLVRIDRMVINSSSWSNGMLHDLSKLEYVQLSGTFTSWKLSKLLKACPKLIKADLSGFNVTITNDSSSELFECFLGCSVLKEADIRGFDTSYCRNFSGTFNQCSALKKLTIGNFSNAAMTTKGTLLASATGCTLICTTTTPPVLKNCAFSDGVAQDEYSSTYDWVAGHFSAIYVPSNAVQAYKTNTYVENGTVGNTGWSKYADIINDIAEYNG